MMNLRRWIRSTGHLRQILFSSCLILLLFSPGGILTATNALGGVVINEFMADNASTVADQDGEYDDWIEFYNNGSEAVSLSGYYLSDDISKPTQWTFPDVSIPAGGYLIVWADGDTTQAGLHTGFGLSKSGEVIVLSAPDQTVIDQVTFGAQTKDVSMARYPNGTGGFIALGPTYAAENIVSSVPFGDVDGSSVVDLADAVAALQVLAGMTPSATLHREADVNNDQRIGMEEVLYVLRTVAIPEDSSTAILLNDDAITVSGTGATAVGGKVTITSSGTYTISGTLTDGQIIVNTTDTGTVNLVLNGVNIGNSTSAPVYVVSSAGTVITLADNTNNYVTDGAAYVYENVGDDEPDAAVFSKDDLTIEGNGSLTVTGNYLDGIAGKDGLTITGGTITVNAKDDGIRGRDYLLITGGTIAVNAIGDGLKATNDEDTTKGYISIAAGVFNVVSGSDALQAETNVTITGGQFTLTSGGGSSATLATDASAKGIKGLVGIRIDSGTFAINSADDTLHSNGAIVINGGTFALSSGDDGIHADTSIEINGGDMNISKSYEGIESTVITVNNGNIHIISSDDGVNGAGGVDSSGIDVRPGQGGFTPPAGGTCHLYVNGGYLAINAAGDGIDVNGAIDMTGGVVIVHGPTDSGNGAIDYDGTFMITGGFLVAAGSAGMAQAPGTSSTQNSLLLTFNSARQAGALVHIQAGNGSNILTFAPAKTYQTVAFSSPDLITGTTYDVYYGGSSSGRVSDGLYGDGTYTPGTKYKSFTVSGVVTTVR